MSYRIATLILGAVLALPAALYGPSAQAQGLQDPFYLGFGIGRDYARVPQATTVSNGVTVTGSGNNNHDTTINVYGGYRFTPNWGIEIAYGRIGNHSVTAAANGLSATANYDIDSFRVYGTGTLPVSPNFSFIGKIGAAHNRLSGGGVSVAGGAMSINSDSANSLAWGVGGEIALNRQWGLRVEYEDYGKFSGNDVWGTGGSGAVKSSAWTGSLKYAF